jgi:3-(3-hydroxy-phenyl)propionate hydroxylase
MPKPKRVVVVGAGPVGLTAACLLARHDIPVTVLEAGSDLSTESRASTFHPPTLDMLDELGAAAPLLAEGLTAPTLQYRTKADGRVAQFDFGLIADVTRHPYRLQAEQSKLTRILYGLFRDHPRLSVEFDSRVEDLTQTEDGVAVSFYRGGRAAVIDADWVIGADGARSAARRATHVEFEGFTWPERFLVVSTPFDFTQVVPNLCSVSYVADPVLWHFFLQIPGLWRIMFPVPAAIDDDTAVGSDYVQAQMATLVPGISSYEVAHRTLYRVHQRVAQRFQVGRVFLVGDAAHINNPLGGMGMNGGIHDAVNLVGRLAKVCHGEAGMDELEHYDRQRRGVTLEYVQTQTIRNKENLEARDPAQHAEFKRRLRTAAADPKLAYQYLLNLSMIASLRRAAELG